MAIAKHRRSGWQFCDFATVALIVVAVSARQGSESSGNGKQRKSLDFLVQMLFTYKTRICQFFQRRSTRVYLSASYLFGEDLQHFRDAHAILHRLELQENAGHAVTDAFLTRTSEVPGHLVVVQPQQNGLWSKRCDKKFQTPKLTANRVYLAARMVATKH